MAGRLILGYVLACAPLLMIAFVVVASGAGVPDGHVIPARVAVVVVVVPFIGVGCWGVAGCSWWNAGSGSSRSGDGA